MLKKDVKIGRIYEAKVSEKITRVRIDSACTHGGWNATNLATGREVLIKSAMKLRREIPEALGGQHASTTPVTNSEEEKVIDAAREKALSTFAQKVSQAQSNEVAAIPPHLIIVARAGTGKTTTLVEGLKAIRGISSSITPSPQQAAVWESLGLSKDAKSVCFVAFNKSIATELQRRVPEGMSAMTLHSLGYKAVQAAFGRVQINEYRVQDIIEEVTGRDIRELRRFKPEMVKAVQELVGLCKQNLVGTDTDSNQGDWVDENGMEGALLRLAAHYDVELNGNSREVLDLVPKVLERCKDVAKDGCIDFDDMIWIPVALGLPVSRYDLLLVDEAQDLNRCQQQLALAAGKRLVLCGDPKQAIYGFAGADSESMPRMQTILENLGGCQVLPLNVTRRCGKAIVAEAQKYVPDFEAFESNAEGYVLRASYNPQSADYYANLVQDGDFILCRVNAPLVSQAFRFIRNGRRANIQGRNIGQGLISTVKKLGTSTVADFVGKLSDWLHAEVAKENAKRNPSEQRLIALQDRYECLEAFAEGACSVEHIIQKIETMFTDDKDVKGIRLSSIHRAKGLEAGRVFFLRPEGAPCPHPMAKTSHAREQEQNLCYVAITRAIHTLVHVS